MHNTLLEELPFKEKGSISTRGNTDSCKRLKVPFPNLVDRFQTYYFKTIFMWTTFCEQNRLNIANLKMNGYLTDWPDQRGYHLSSQWPQPPSVSSGACHRTWKRCRRSRLAWGIPSWWGHDPCGARSASHSWRSGERERERGIHLRVMPTPNTQNLWYRNKNKPMCVNQSKKIFPLLLVILCMTSSQIFPFTFSAKTWN